MRVTMKLLCLPKNTSFAFKWVEEGYHGTIFWGGLAGKDGDSFRINVFVNRPRGFELEIDNPECEIFRSSGVVSKNSVYLNYWLKDYARTMINHSIPCPILIKKDPSHDTANPTPNRYGQYWRVDKYHQWVNGRWSINSSIEMRVVGIEL